MSSAGAARPEGMATDVEQYLSALPDATRPLVERVLDAVRAGVPGGEEKVRYGMPAVMMDGRYAIHVAGWKKHIGIYPVSPLPEPLESRIAPYRAAKDAINFRYAEPIPYDLITEVAAQLLAQVAARP